MPARPASKKATLSNLNSVPKAQGEDGVREIAVIGISANGETWK
jgi:hypothetical protein